MDIVLINKSLEESIESKNIDEYIKYCGIERFLQFENITSAIVWSDLNQIKGCNFIYLIQINDTYTKLGYSSNICSRLKQHRMTMNKKDINSGKVYLFQIPYGIYFEERLHDALFLVMDKYSISLNDIVYDYETYPLTIKSMTVLFCTGLLGFRNRNGASFSSNDTDSTKEQHEQYDKDILQKRLKKLNQKKEIIINNYINGKYTKKEYKQRFLEVECELDYIIDTKKNNGTL